MVKDVASAVEKAKLLYVKVICALQKLPESAEVAVIYGLKVLIVRLSRPAGTQSKKISREETMSFQGFLRLALFVIVTVAIGRRIRFR